MNDGFVTAELDSEPEYKVPETGAGLARIVSITFAQWTPYDQEYDYKNTISLTADEAIKLRDSLNELDL